MSYQIQEYYSQTEKEKISRIFQPPPEISGSDWANLKRILSKEDSAEPGRYSTDRAPYQKEPLDEITNPRNERIVLVWSSQSGKSLIATNTLGYYIDQDPSSIMYVIETIDKAEKFSKNRLDPMIRDNDWLKIDRKIKYSGNTILEKYFPGGFLQIVGANSAAGLTSMPIRILICDEVDGYPLSAGALGSPMDLAIQRTEAFDNRKIILISSPGVEGISKIYPEFLETDQRYYFLPCVYCGYYQKLVWSQLKFPDRNPDNCYYECFNCKKELEEKDKFKMIVEGVWRKTYPERINKPGFHLSRMYSVFSSWNKMAAEFLKAKKTSRSGDNGPLQVFINSSLAELWNPYTAPTNTTELIKRTESYLDGTETDPIIPKKVVLLTAGIDVQDDRLEIKVKGWGIDEESWIIDYKVFRGEPALKGLWNELDLYLKKTYMHYLGIKIGITAAAIDTGGHYTEKVYDFVRYKQARRIYGIKGSSVSGKTIAPKSPSKNNKGKIPLYIIGTTTAKDIIYARLRITDLGPGYMHFEKRFCDEDYFEQLTSNKRVQTKRGYEYELLPGKRDEVLDTEVYAYSALKIYNRDLRLIEKILHRTAEIRKEGKQIKQPLKKKSFALR